MDGWWAFMVARSEGQWFLLCAAWVVCAVQLRTYTNTKTHQHLLGTIPLGLYLVTRASLSKAIAHSGISAVGQRRYFLMRLPMVTALSTRRGHRIVLRGSCHSSRSTSRTGVLVGKQARVPARLILQRVPEEVAQQRRQRLRESA